MKNGGNESAEYEEDEARMVKGGVDKRVSEKGYGFQDYPMQSILFTPEDRKRLLDVRQEADNVNYMYQHSGTRLDFD